MAPGIAHLYASRCSSGWRFRFLILLAGLILAFIAYRMTNPSRWPTDNQLLKHYATNRASFSLLSEKALSDRATVELTMLTRLSLKGAPADARAPGVLFFRFADEKLDLDVCETDVMEKGYAYSVQGNLSTVGSLDALPVEFGRRYIRVDSGWYIYASRFAEMNCE